ncbi:MAG: molybdate ABC transporter permease subunit, partial [Methanomethylovorans sp.]
MLDQVWFPLYITLKISLVSSLIVAILGTLISYILARREFMGKWLIDSLVTLPMILPPTVTG